MTIVELEWSALPVPVAVEVPDGVSKDHRFGPDFSRLESAHGRLGSS